MTIRDLTDKQLVRLACRLWERIQHGQGYQPFGCDMATLRLTRPGLANAYAMVWSEGRRRGL